MPGLVLGIRVSMALSQKCVDGRGKPGHHEERCLVS
jgi:hypothetical protein